jgi:hypothetical protein
MDADALLTNGAEADGEVVWSWHPDAGVKSAEATPPMTVAKEPGHRGSTKETVKTIARGMPGVFRCDRGD